MSPYGANLIAAKNASAIIDAEDLESFYGEALYIEMLEDEHLMNLLSDAHKLIVKHIRELY